MGTKVVEEIAIFLVSLNKHNILLGLWDAESEISTQGTENSFWMSGGTRRSGSPGNEGVRASWNTNGL